MKKLMIALAATAMAVAAQASTFSWGYSGALDAETFDGATAILFLSDGGALPSTTGWDTKSTPFTVADLTASGATQFRTGTINADGTFTSDSEDLQKINNKTGSFKFYMAVITDDGKNVALTTGTKTARIVTATTPAAPAWASTALKTYTVAAAPTPEPTSAMLLLLGFAGMALRRKRA